MAMKPRKAIDRGKAIDRVLIDGPELVVEGVTFDLLNHLEKKVTVFKVPDGSITIEPKPFHQSTICELEVPPAVVTAEDTDEVDDMGMPMIREVIAPIDLSKVKIHIFEGGE